MDYKNDDRTPRDRITGEFLSELLFTEKGGDMDWRTSSAPACGCRNNEMRQAAGQNNCSSNVRSRTFENSCPQRRSNVFPRRNNVEITGNYSLAMAYVPMQEFGELFDIETGFCEGTIFKELRFPFYPTPCSKEAD